MASEGFASTVRLGSVCSKIGSGATPRGGSKVYFERGECALIRSQNVYNNGFYTNGLVYIGPEHASQLDNVEVQSGDVLLNITGDSVARCCQVVDDVLPARVNQHVAIIRPNSSKLDPMYLRYYLVSPRMQAKMLSWARSGGTRNALTKGMIESFDIPTANIKEQHAIAQILGSLDDKIELNRRMNETLEAMARAIFKSWFVDFDLVKAKAEGKRPAGINAETAKLFPDSFLDSELGSIPKGWKLTTFDKITDFVIGGDWGKENPEGEFSQPVYCIRGADIPPLQNAVLSSKMPIRYIKESSLRKRGLLPGDIVFEISGGSPTQQTGRTVLVSTDLLRRLNYSLICSNFCRLVRVKKRIPSCFIYFWLRWLYSIDSFWQYETGTTGIKNFAFKVFGKQHSLCLPPEELLSSFSERVKPLLKKRDANGLESQTLASIRDALLPKLLSGEIRVKDAEKFVGEYHASQTSSQTIYTVGHSNYEADGFIKILHSHSIEVVVDVRSAPYSKYCSQFNKKTIEQALKLSRIKYLFLGKELGARPKDQNCYINGKVSFEKLREIELFKQGIARLLDGIQKCNIAVMCSEKDPINCHRAVLISRVLTNKGVTVKHILNETEILDHAELEEQLLKKFKIEDRLFDNKSSKRANLEQAYQKQEETIAYQETVQEGIT